MTVTVKWGKERLHLDLPPPNTKLSALRKLLADHTHLPEDAFKLVHAGGVMKDNNAPISAYGLRDNSTVVMIGGDQPLPDPPSAPSSASSKRNAERPTEQSTITQIRSELAKIRADLVPSVDSFLDTLASPEQNATAPSAQLAINAKTPLEQEHLRLGELLLQALLRLDAILPEGSWEGARQERKGAVREVQGLLDRLDGGWKSRV